jgi:hypothetical protein
LVNKKQTKISPLQNPSPKRHMPYSCKVQIGQVQEAFLMESGQCGACIYPEFSSHTKELKVEINRNKTVSILETVFL